ncbi:MAG: peptidylprolyl isomerase [Planctomycetota bacterium]
MSDSETPPVHVKLSTTLGDVYLELDAERAPKTVENFLHYVDTGFYEGTIFHRVISNFMAQGGGMTPDYERKAPTRKPIKNEANNRVSNGPGTLAMARTGDPHSASSQFFINLVPNRGLDHTSEDPNGWGYCVFGKVIAGLDTVEQIKNAPVKLDPKADARMPARPKEPIVIESAARIEASDVPAE